MSLRAAIINPPTSSPNCACKEGRCANEDFFPMLHLPPLSLLYPASILERDGHRVGVCDGVVEPETAWDGLKGDLFIVNVTPMAYDEDMAFLNHLKEDNPDALVAAMGMVPTCRPGRVLADGADAALVGEVESTVGEMAARIEDGESLTGLPGLSVKYRGKIHHGGECSRSCLDALPYPARHLVNGDRYRFHLTGEVLTSVLTGRGCHHHCTFCAASIINGKLTRNRAPVGVVDEMRVVSERDGTRLLVLFADTFNASRSFVEELCDLIIAEGLDLNWACNSRADGLDDTLLQRMSRAGCRYVNIGGESGSDMILSRARKGESTADIRSAVEACVRAGITPVVYFMFGLPGETRETVQETIDLALSIPTDHVIFKAATPLLDTPFAREVGMDDDDLTSPRDLVHAIVESEVVHVSSEEIEDLLREAFGRFFIRPGVLARHASRVARQPERLVYSSKAALGLLRYLLAGCR